MKHSGDSNVLWGYISAESTGWLVKVEGNVNSAKYSWTKTLNSLQETCNLGDVIQQDNDPKHTDKATHTWFKH